MSPICRLHVPYMYSMCTPLCAGSCQCDSYWYTADCSVQQGVPPYSSEMPANGLCDTRYMKCTRVIVYGESFIRNVNLTCHLQEAHVCSVLALIIVGMVLF